MVVKSFEKWKTQEVEDTFGIQFLEEYLKMDKWLESDIFITDLEAIRLEILRKKLKLNADFWGEEDIKAFFIFQIIDIIDFYEFGKYRTFTEATFEAEVKDIHHNSWSLRGRVEMIVATGKQVLQTPFFFLNEYKPQIKAVSDPKGQLLIAMLAAQTKNKDTNFPIYGMYNIGQNFFFILLEEKKYTISKQFDATEKQDLEKIVSMLQFVKNHIENIVNSSI